MTTQEWLAQASTQLENGAADEAEQTSPSWSRSGRYLAWTSRRGVTASPVVVEIATGRLIEIPTEGVVEELSWFGDDDTLCAVLTSPVAPRDAWRLPIDGGAATRLTAAMPAAVAARPMVAPETIRFTIGEVEIEALLYVPVDVKESERRPGLVYVHGGPTWLVDRGWRPEIQHLVSCGYTVIAPNFSSAKASGFNARITSARPITSPAGLFTAASRRSTSG